ncbi:MAG: hypothetical protein ACRDYA_02260 [Egibacteraceae bacterium]
MTGIVDPPRGRETRSHRPARMRRRVIDGQALSADRGETFLGHRRLGRRRLTIVVLGLAVMLGGIVFLRGLGNQFRYSVSARIVGGDTLETTGERGWVRLGVGDDVPDGARIRTGSSQVRLEFRDGQIWLGPDAAARVFSQRVDLIRGEAMVVDPEGGMLSVHWTDVLVSGRGTFRLTPGVNPRVGVYTGSVRVRRPAESRPVGALEQLDLSNRRLPVSPTPLDYAAQDPWDRELLGQAVAFDDEVERIARGIDVKFAVGAKPPEFYRVFKAVDDATLPILESTARTITPDGEFGPVSDVLVTLFVAEAAARATGKPLSAAATQTASWRAEGARWGLVAMRFGITASDFAKTVDLSQIDRLTRDPPKVTGPRNSVPVEPDMPAKVPAKAPDRPVQPTAEDADADDLDPSPHSESPRALVPVPSLSPLPTVPDVTSEEHATTRPLDDDGSSEVRRTVDGLLDLLGVD